MKILDKSERKGYIPTVVLRIRTPRGAVTLPLDQRHFPLELEIVTRGTIRQYTLNLHEKDGEPCSATLT